MDTFQAVNTFEEEESKERRIQLRGEDICYNMRVIISMILLEKHSKQFLTCYQNTEIGPTI